MRAVDFISKELFGSRVGFIEHAVINALQKEGVSLTRILEMAEDWKKNEVKPK